MNFLCSFEISEISPISTFGSPSLVPAWVRERPAVRLSGFQSITVSPLAGCGPLWQSALPSGSGACGSWLKQCDFGCLSRRQCGKKMFLLLHASPLRRLMNRLRFQNIPSPAPSWRGRGPGFKYSSIYGFIWKRTPVYPPGRSVGRQLTLIL